MNSRLFDFEGRTGRSEYWAFVGIYLVATMLTAFVGAFLGVGMSQGRPEEMTTMMVLLICIQQVIFLIPFVALTVRRCHDFGATGWLCVLSFIPYVGGIVSIVFGFLPGDPTSNRFGEPEELRIF